MESEGIVCSGVERRRPTMLSTFSSSLCSSVVLSEESLFLEKCFFILSIEASMVKSLVSTFSILPSDCVTKYGPIHFVVGFFMYINTSLLIPISGSASEGTFLGGALLMRYVAMIFDSSSIADCIAVILWICTDRCLCRIEILGINPNTNNVGVSPLGSAVSLTILSAIGNASSYETSGESRRIRE